MVDFTWDWFGLDSEGRGAGRQKFGFGTWFAFFSFEILSSLTNDDCYEPFFFPP